MQFAQRIAPSQEKVPIGHEVHSTPTKYVPALHLLHALDPGIDVIPNPEQAVQAEDDVAPVMLEYVPARQFVH